MTVFRDFFRLTDTEKFSVYMRFSLHALILALALMSFEPVSEWPNVKLSAVFISVALVNGLCVILVIEKSPALSTNPKPVGLLYPTAIGINIISWASTLTFISVHRFSSIANAASGLAVFLLSCFALGLTIHLKYRYWIALTLAGITAAIVRHPALDHPGYVIAFTLLLTWGSNATVWSVEIVKELHRTRGLQTQLRVHEERLRFAQELHDSLGQHLAAISLKTQLAISLHEKDASKARSELREIEKIVRLMREDLHQVVSGYRTLSPESELDAARNLLHGAGISISITGSPESIPVRCHQASAWFIREATTNVMKHSQASTVCFNLSKHEVSVTNDGAERDIGELGGLQTLQHRAQKVGGTISLTKQSKQFTATLSWQEA